MSTLLVPHHDLRLPDRHVRRGVDEVTEQMPRLGCLVAVADAAASMRYKLLAISVSCRSQLTFIATAEDKASM